MFSKKLVEILQIKNISAYYLAKNTGISQGLMSDYKNGIKMPNIQNLTKIADCLDCSVDYLLGRTDDISLDEHGEFINLFDRLSKKDKDIIINEIKKLIQINNNE